MCDDQFSNYTPVENGAGLFKYQEERNSLQADFSGCRRRAKRRVISGP
jgi:hypothetical protein